MEVKAEARSEAAPEAKAETGEGEKERRSSRSRRGGRGRSKAVKVEAKAAHPQEGSQPKPEKKEPPAHAVVHPVKEEGGKPKQNRRRYYRGRPKKQDGGQ